MDDSHPTTHIVKAVERNVRQLDGHEDQDDQRQERHEQRREGRQNIHAASDHLPLRFAVPSSLP